MLSIRRARALVEEKQANFQMTVIMRMLNITPDSVNLSFTILPGRFPVFVFFVATAATVAATAAAHL